MATKNPVAKSQAADAAQPSRTLKILAQLRGEDPNALLAGKAAEDDEELQAYSPDDEEGDEQPGPEEPEGPQVASALIGNPKPTRPRLSAAYRGLSPATRR